MISSLRLPFVRLGRVLLIVCAAPLSADDFKYELKEPVIVSLMTTKEKESYERGMRELAKWNKEVSEDETLLKNKKMPKSRLDADRKRVAEAKAALESIKGGVVDRVRAAVPSATVSILNIADGFSVAGDTLGEFAASNGISGIGFLGVVLWSGDKPKLDPTLGTAFLKRLREIDLKWDDLSKCASEAGPAAKDASAVVLLGEVIDDPVHAGKLVTMRLMEPRRMIVIKSFTWLVPKDSKSKGRFGVMFGDEQALFYKMSVLNPAVGRFLCDVPPLGAAVQTALVKQALSDNPNCELSDAAFVQALTGTVSEPMPNVRTLSPVSEKGRIGWYANRPGEKPLIMGTLEVIAVK